MPVENGNHLSLSIKIQDYKFTLDTISGPSIDDPSFFK